MSHFQEIFAKHAKRQIKTQLEETKEASDPEKKNSKLQRKV